MSKQLRASLEQILAMPYYKNEAARSGTVVNGHEEALSNLLISQGFDRVREFKTNSYLGQAYLKSNGQDWISMSYPNLKPGSFITQPSGSNNFPDFLLQDFDGRYLLLEAKSGNGTSISWNDNLPKPNVIYIFSSARPNQTTIFLGQDVLDVKQENIIDVLRKNIDNLVRKANLDLMDADTKHRGWNYYPRPKFQQLQGRQNGKSMLKIERVDYFKHADRIACEQRALEFASG